MASCVLSSVCFLLVCSICVTSLHNVLYSIFSKRNTLFTERGASGYDPIPPLAKAIADESRLLCFDEFQVTGAGFVQTGQSETTLTSLFHRIGPDISDAAILHRLLRSLLLTHRVFFFATSNRPPSELYKNGINREV